MSNKSELPNNWNRLTSHNDLFSVSKLARSVMDRNRSTYTPGLRDSLGDPESVDSSMALIADTVNNLYPFTVIWNRDEAKTRAVDNGSLGEVIQRAGGRRTSQVDCRLSIAITIGVISAFAPESVSMMLIHMVYPDTEDLDIPIIGLHPYLAFVPGYSGFDGKVGLLHYDAPRNGRETTTHSIGRVRGIDNLSRQRRMGRYLAFEASNDGLMQAEKAFIAGQNFLKSLK